MDHPARRRVEFPVIDGTVYFPPVVTSTCGLSMGNVWVSQPTTGQRDGNYGQCREQRDTVNAVAVESALAVAPAAVGACQPDSRTSQLQDDPVMVNGSNDRDVKESTQPRASEDSRRHQSSEQGPVMEQYSRNISRVNLLSCQDRLHRPAASHGLRPEAAPFVSACEHPPTKRQLQDTGCRGTFYSCPDIGQRDTVVGGGIRQQLPPHWRSVVRQQTIQS